MPEDLNTLYLQGRVFNSSFLTNWPDWIKLYPNKLDDIDSFCTYLMISI